MVEVRQLSILGAILSLLAKHLMHEWISFHPWLEILTWKQLIPRLQSERTSSLREVGRGLRGLLLWKSLEKHGRGSEER